MPKLVLDLDQIDFDTIQNEIARRQALSRKLAPNEPTIVPEGESCLAGALIAESIRDLDEYRSIYAGGI